MVAQIIFDYVEHFLPRIHPKSVFSYYYRFDFNPWFCLSEPYLYSNLKAASNGNNTNADIKLKADKTTAEAIARPNSAFSPALPNATKVLKIFYVRHRELKKHLKKVFIC
jgi:hypothetical protein